RSAADIGLRNFTKLDARNRSQQIARLRADALRVVQSAGAVVGDAHREGMPSRSWLEVGQQFRDVDAFRRKGAGALGVGGIVAQQVAVTFHRGPAAGRV